MKTRKIEVKTQDGTAKATLVEPGSFKTPREQPGVILYMDAFGPRPALHDMAQRLAGAGYLVLVPDLFYRHGAYGPFIARSAFSEPASRDKIKGMLSSTTQEMTRRDSVAFLATLTQAGAGGRIGTVGYCMGGGRAITAAASFPDRIAAAASFHGGGLASDAPDSPHRIVNTIKGRVYVGCAGVDSSFPPEQSARLAQALREAEVDHQIENYVGVQHGWPVPDHSAFDARGAERHWTRLLTLFEEMLR